MIDRPTRRQGSLWTTCHSGYCTDGGKVVALWPGFADEYRHAIARPNFADYVSDDNAA